MKNELENIDHLFKSALGSYSETPPPEVWVALEQRLEQKGKRRPVAFAWYWLALVSCLLVAAGALFALRNSKNTLTAHRDISIAGSSNTASGPAVQLQKESSTVAATEHKTSLHKTLSTVAPVYKHAATTPHSIAKTIHARQKHTTPNQPLIATAKQREHAAASTAPAIGKATALATVAGAKEQQAWVAQADAEVPAAKLINTMSDDDDDPLSENDKRPVYEDGSDNVTIDPATLRAAKLSSSPVITAQTQQIRHAKTTDRKIAKHASQPTVAAMPQKLEKGRSNTPPATPLLAAHQQKKNVVRPAAPRHRKPTAIADHAATHKPVARLPQSKPTDNVSAGSAISVNTKNTLDNTIAATNVPEKHRRSTGNKVPAKQMQPQHPVTSRTTSEKSTAASTNTASGSAVAMHVKHTQAVSHKRKTQSRTTKQPGSTAHETAPTDTASDSAVAMHTSHTSATSHKHERQPRGTKLPGSTAHETVSATAPSKAERNGTIASVSAKKKSTNTGSIAAADQARLPRAKKHGSKKATDLSLSNGNIDNTPVVQRSAPAHEPAKTAIAVHQPKNKKQYTGGKTGKKVATQSIASQTPNRRNSKQAAPNTGNKQAMAAVNTAQQSVGNVQPATGNNPLNALASQPQTAPATPQQPAAAQKPLPADTTAKAPVPAGTAGTDSNTKATDKWTTARWTLGVKAGYERGFSKDDAQKMLVSPFLEYRINDRMSLMTQPSIKSAYLSSKAAPGTQSYYKLNNDSTRVLLDSIPGYVVGIGDTMMIRDYGYTRSHDSLIKTYAMTRRYMELDLPILFKYKLKPNFSIYGGVNLIYSKQIGLMEQTSTILVRDSAYAFTSAPLHSPAPAAPLLPSVLNSAPGTPISSYSGPLYPSPSGGSLRLGYMLGFSYEYRRRWLADVLLQQGMKSANYQGGINVNAALSGVYYRFTIGYKLFAR